MPPNIVAADAPFVARIAAQMNAGTLHAPYRWSVPLASMDLLTAKMRP